MLKRLSLITIMAVLSISLTTAPSDGDRDGVWGRSRAGCRIQIKTDRERYRFGEPIKLGWSLQNIDRETLEAPVGNLIRVQATLWTPSGALASQTEWERLEEKEQMKGSSMAIDHLRKGEILHREVGLLNRMYDMSADGKYTLCVSYTVESQLDPEAGVTLFSNTLSIEVAGE